jgi:para-aminobenzoate synthetase component 1
MGFFADGGAAHWNVAIRTITLSGAEASFHVGAGIVADSDPEQEWKETVDKGQALYRCLAASMPSQTRPMETPERSAGG